MAICLYSSWNNILYCDQGSVATTCDCTPWNPILKYPCSKGVLGNNMGICGSRRGNYILLFCTKGV